MTDRFAPWVIVIILCVMFWTVVAQMVLGGSRQTCEETSSGDVCQWELR